ncbi:MAG: hypothetical protein IJP80_05900 [Bacteroidales bacterium]|nr:hypothetical protein [Bacteroidales bacterium]
MTTAQTIRGQQSAPTIRHRHSHHTGRCATSTACIDNSTNHQRATVSTDHQTPTLTPYRQMCHLDRLY